MVSGCFHCGSALGDPRYAVVLGAERAFCCSACEAVARTITQAGLQAYYETRSAAAAKPEAKPIAPLPADISSTALILERIRCAACLWLIEAQLGRQPGVTHASVNYATRRAQVAWDPKVTSLAALIGAIRAVGYDAERNLGPGVVEPGAGAIPVLIVDRDEVTRPRVG